MDQSERSLQLVGAIAGACVVGRVEDTVGRNEVSRTTGSKPAPVAGAAIVRQIVETRRSGTKGQQVFAADGGVATVVAPVTPACGLTGKDVQRESAVAIGYNPYIPI